MIARSSAVYWVTAVAGALVLLAVAHPLVSIGARSPYKIANSLNGKKVFSVVNAKPGSTGKGTLSLQNLGVKPFKVELTQDQVTNSGFGGALELQVYDVTSKHCLYPQKKKGACTAWGACSAGVKMRRVPVLSKKSTSLWPPKEKHSLNVVWRFSSTAPNTTQGQSASFRLQWRGRA
jgi:hypothetical protein